MDAAVAMSAMSRWMSAFLRELLASEAAMPPIDDVMTTIASREPIGCDIEDLRSFIKDERQ